MDIGIPPWLSGSLLEPDKHCWLTHWLLSVCADICAINYQHEARSVQIPRSYCDECDRVCHFWRDTLAGTVADTATD
ncbi:hypothetical protein [Nostoc punctiforme]|uniref:hypothetical protein n=1 Tax=Nostoc punctiforme TaxID=272131 RepID=UPI0011D15997|nr:hypothetical protein [Nostoc punctiforme]